MDDRATWTARDALPQLLDLPCPFFTDPVAALQLAAERRRDGALMAELQRFAPGLPDHFRALPPGLYLRRVLASPSNEIMACLELTRSLGLRLIVGEDPDAEFAGLNRLQRALCRPVIAAPGALPGTRRTWVNLLAHEARPIRGQVTMGGLSQVAFHRNFLRRAPPPMSWHGRNPAGSTPLGGGTLRPGRMRSLPG